MARILFSRAIATSVAVLLAPLILAQNLVTVTTTGAGPINLTQKVAVTTFIASNADSANIFKDVAVGQAQSSILTTVAGSIIKLPVVGPFGTLLWAGIFGKSLLHHGGTSTKGFEVTYLQGLSASVAVARGNSSFVIPVQILQASGIDSSTLSLLRVRPSAKDSARIVRSTHVVIKQTNSKINPAASTEVLGIEQDAVASKTETANGSIILTPDAPLEAGDYALVMQSPGDVAGAAVSAWDFTVR